MPAFARSMRVLINAKVMDRHSVRHLYTATHLIVSEITCYTRKGHNLLQYMLL